MKLSPRFSASFLIPLLLGMAMIGYGLFYFFLTLDMFYSGSSFSFVLCVGMAELCWLDTHFSINFHIVGSV